MSMNASKARLGAVTKDLLVQWTETKQSWLDAKCAEFEKEHLEELFLSVGNATQVIEQLDKLVHKIRSDCE